MFPFTQFLRPCITGDSQGANDKYAVDFEAVEQEIVDGGQRQNRLAKLKSHIKQDC